MPSNPLSTHQQQQPKPIYPFAFSTFLLIFILSIILSLTTLNPHQYFANSFPKIIHDYQIWRIATGWIYEEHFLVDLIITMQFLGLIHRYECKNGSIVAFYAVIVSYAVYSVLLLLLQGTIYFLTNAIHANSETRDIEWFINPGLLFITTNMIYKHCFYNPNITVKAPYPFNRKVLLKYYPFVFYFFVVSLSIVSWILVGTDKSTIPGVIAQVMRLDFLVAVGLSMMQCQYFNGGLILYSVSSYNKNQQYLSHIHATDNEYWIPFNTKQIQSTQNGPISEQKFYENLGHWQYGKKWNQITQGLHSDEAASIIKNQQSYFKGQGVLL